MAKPVDLHALANMHGAGLAQTALRKAGHWDEYAGKTAREYRVKVSYSIQHEDTKIVTGLGRCGTTMTMAMLDAGGFPVAGPRPGYEVSAHFRPGQIDPAWLDQQAGSAVKVVDPSLYNLHRHTFAAPPVIVMLERDRRAQARSQIKLLSGLRAPKASEKAWVRSLDKAAPVMRARLHRLGPVYRLRFEDVVADPEIAAVQLSVICNTHFGRGLDVQRAANAVIHRGPACLPGLEMETMILPELAAAIASGGVIRHG